MAAALSLAMADAGLPAEAIGFVNGQESHQWGDIAENKATADVLETVYLPCIEELFGHSLGACGSIEAWLGIEMMKDRWFAPTANLVNVDERCAELDYHCAGRRRDIEFLMSNNSPSAIDTSLIFRRC